ncbi:2-hydroxychromene-2-carboxylate isomerase family protein [Roseobacter sp. AzwK-3b]|uniref:2-hydroxychromene-2-carboxylate isomerase n=1 Tax=Roseobacter sp. AzwK-3b TaxID=351016 RepID=UPI0001568F90|nr:DsbA family protein [Roseobacter sp. AzwK-3b]EDM72542.1 2-hydroxychromene-2-carboxylate isomerase family protein [Roseobacter sp. AzwK-3b]
MPKSLEYWFTCGSTYNYLTVNRIEAAAADAGIDLVLRPFHLGQIFREAGFWPFHAGTPKMDYMWHDIQRTAKGLGLSPKLPAPYPCPETDIANRIALVTIQEGHGLAWVKASYRVWFEDGLPVGGIENLAASLGSLGLNIDAMLSAAEAADTDLQAYTEHAKALRIFGAPTFVVGEELYWGNDRLEQSLATALQL